MFLKIKHEKNKSIAKKGKNKEKQGFLSKRTIFLQLLSNNKTTIF